MRTEKTARKTARGRPFSQGHDPRRGHGIKGRSGRKPLVYRDALKTLDQPALETLGLALEKGTWSVRVRAAQDVLDRLHGKPRQRVEDLRRVLALESLRTELRAKGVAEEDLPKGLPRIRFHDLRHTAASLLLQQGVHPKVVQERLGHASIAMTLDIYSHVVPGMQEQAVHALEMRLFGLPEGGVEVGSPSAE